jgi:phosphotransferase system IIB component
MAHRERGSDGSAQEAGFEPVGCGCLILIAMIMAWPILVDGQPASFLSLGLFLASWLIYIATKRLKKPQPAAQASKGRLGFRIATALLASSAQAILWTAVGLALVWMLQLIYHVVPERIEADQALQIQLDAYDWSHQLKSDFTPVRFVLFILGALALSTAIGSLWPINVVGKIKKLTMAAAAILIAFSTMSFVTAQTGSSRFDASVQDIRATIGGDLERLRQARQEKAALQWVGASLQQTRQSPTDVDLWHSFFRDAESRCDAAESAFAKGYLSYQDAPRVRESNYCSKSEYLAALSKNQLQNQLLSPSEGEFWPWLPEFGRLRGSNTSHLPKIGNVAHFADVQKLANRIRQSANDEEKARDQVQSSVTAAMGSFLPDNTPEIIGPVVDALKDAVLAAVYRDGRDKIAMWLQLKNTSLPRPVSVVLGIEPQIKLVPPRHVATGSPRTNFFAGWLRGPDQAGSQSIRELGRQAAIRDRQRDIEERQREQQEEAALLERARESRTEVERAP